MGILEELDKGERKLLMMMVKELGNPLGHIAMELFPPEAMPEDFKFIQLLEARGFLEVQSRMPCRDPDDRVSGTRTFYRLTKEGVKVATELQAYLSRGAPDTLPEYRAWAAKLFDRIMATSPAGMDCRPALEIAKGQLNLLATRFEIISKTDEENETWTFDVVRRITKKNRN